MTGFEYALALLSVMIGLTLSEIATDLHRLVRNAGTVRWDGRVILSTALATVVTVRMWFTFWRIQDDELVLVFPFYLSIFVAMMVLYMIGASCLPEDPPADCNLADFYERNRRSLWSLFAVFQTIYFAHGLYFAAGAPLLARLPVLAALAAYVLLAAVRTKWLHYLLPTLLIAEELHWNWSRTLGGAIG
jgi:hypothetical protein